MAKRKSRTNKRIRTYSKPAAVAAEDLSKYRKMLIIPVVILIAYTALKMNPSTSEYIYLVDRIFANTAITVAMFIAFLLVFWKKLNLNHPSVAGIAKICVMGLSAQYSYIWLSAGNLRSVFLANIGALGLVLLVDQGTKFFSDTFITKNNMQYTQSRSLVMALSFFAFVLPIANDMVATQFALIEDQGSSIVLQQNFDKAMDYKMIKELSKADSARYAALQPLADGVKSAANTGNWLNSQIISGAMQSAGKGFTQGMLDSMKSAYADSGNHKTTSKHLLALQETYGEDNAPKIKRILDLIFTICLSFGIAFLRMIEEIQLAGEKKERSNEIKGIVAGGNSQVAVATAADESKEVAAMKKLFATLNPNQQKVVTELAMLKSENGARTKLATDLKVSKSMISKMSSKYPALIQYLKGA